jgi:hypothetical protein
MRRRIHAAFFSSPAFGDAKYFQNGKPFWNKCLGVTQRAKQKKVFIDFRVTIPLLTSPMTSSVPASLSAAEGKKNETFSFNAGKKKKQTLRVYFALTFVYVGRTRVFFQILRN